jgi:hypothetical protein
MCTADEKFHISFGALMTWLPMLASQLIGTDSFPTKLNVLFEMAPRQSVERHSVEQHSVK